MQVLLVRVGALGDLLLLRRTIASLKQSGHVVTLLAPAVPASALVGPGVTGVDRLFPWEAIEVVRLLAGGHPREGALRDILLDSDAVFAYTRSAALSQALQAEARQVIAIDPQPLPGHHASWWLAHPLAALGVEGVDAVPAESASPEEGREAGHRVRALEPGFLAVHPGSGSRLKNWPAPRFADFIRSWRRSTGRRSWLLCLGPAEGEGPPELLDLEPDLTAHSWPMRSLGAVLKHAGLFVGNDSGVTHLAAAWGAPTLALFGPTDPAVWSPCGPITQVVRSAAGRMEDLALGPVMDGASALSRAQASE